MKQIIKLSSFLLLLSNIVMSAAEELSVDLSTRHKTATGVRRRDTDSVPDVVSKRTRRTAKASGMYAASLPSFGTLPSDIESKLIPFLKVKELGRFSSTDKEHKAACADRLSLIAREKKLLDPYFSYPQTSLQSDYVIPHEPSAELYAKLDRCTQLGISAKLTIAHQWQTPLTLSQINDLLAHCSCLISFDSGEYNRISAECLMAIVTSPNLINLRSLTLSETVFSLEGARAIANSPYLINLTTLKLSFCALGAEGMRIIAASSHLANLTSLNLSACDIGVGGAAAIANSQFMSNLKSLNLMGNKIGAAGARGIANSRFLDKLRDLDLALSDVGADGTEAIANSPYLSNLTSLRLNDNGIGREGALSLANSRHLVNLTILNLGDNSIGDEGAIAIVNSPSMVKLLTLDLASNKITNEGVMAIASSPDIAHLTILGLDHNKIGYRGVSAIRNSAYLTNTRVNLDFNTPEDDLVTRVFVYVAYSALVGTFHLLQACWCFRR